MLVLLPLAASAATITVNSTADDATAGDGACTLREAIGNVNAAADATGGDCTAGTGTGDTTTFSLVLPASIVLTTFTDLAISGDMSISGPGEDLLAVDGNDEADVFDVTAGTVTISNLTIRNGLGSEGGGISNTATLSLTNCTLGGNAAVEDGGGIYNHGTLTLDDCTLASNSAGGFNRYSGSGQGGGIL